MEIPGIETIQGLVGSPPQRISISYDAIKVAERIRQLWNTMHLAFIPYCFVCKEPLVWHTPPDTDIIFHCPKCNRKWVKDRDWIKKEATSG